VGHQTILMYSGSTQSYHRKPYEGIRGNVWGNIIGIEIDNKKGKPGLDEEKGKNCILKLDILDTTTRREKEYLWFGTRCGEIGEH